MTKKKHPSKLLRRGPKPGSGKGLTRTASTTLTPALWDLVEAEARRRRVKPAAVLRSIVERWGARKLKTARRRLLSVLQARIGDTLSPPLTLEKIKRLGESKHGEGPVLHPFPSWPGPKAGE